MCAVKLGGMAVQAEDVLQRNVIGDAFWFPDGYAHSTQPSSLQLDDSCPPSPKLEFYVPFMFNFRPSALTMQPSPLNPNSFSISPPPSFQAPHLALVRVWLSLLDLLADTILRQCTSPET